MAFSVTVLGFVGTVTAPAGPQVLLSAAVLAAGAVAMANVLMDWWVL